MRALNKQRFKLPYLGTERFKELKRIGIRYERGSFSIADLNNVEKIKEILSDIDLSYILISHDFDFLDETTGAIYLLKNGRIHTDEYVQVHRHVHAHRQGGVPHAHE